MNQPLRLSCPVDDMAASIRADLLDGLSVPVGDGESASLDDFARCGDVINAVMDLLDGSVSPAWHAGRMAKLLKAYCYENARLRLAHQGDR